MQCQRPYELSISARPLGTDILMAVYGVLDAKTYRDLRDGIIKTAQDSPRSVIVDVDHVEVPNDSAWSVFTSARWHIHQWPDVPVMLVTKDEDRRRAVVRTGVTRYVPVFESLTAACVAARAKEQVGVRRVRVRLEPGEASIRHAYAFVRSTLRDWDEIDRVPVVSFVATLLVQNALSYADGDCLLRVETNSRTITVAVTDSSTVLAVRKDPTTRNVDTEPRGLDMVAEMSRHWGNSPMPNGKTVWAVIGPENNVEDVTGLF
jgi:anti-anti-sigma regulatory factor